MIQELVPNRHDPLHDDPHLQQLIDLLLDYEPERIILFGSRARGSCDDYSDYDVVVIKQTDRPFLDRLQDMTPYLARFDRPAEIIVYTPEEFARLGQTGFGWLVQREGKVVYERQAS